MPKHFNFDNTPKEPGIYKIYNMKNKKCYVGSSVNLRKRWGDHLRMLRGNYHHNAHLQRAWEKYGAREFEFIILERVKDKEDLVEREQLWIDKLNSCGEGYNILPHAGSSLGYVFTEEAKRKMSESSKRENLSVKTRRKLSESLRGENHPFYGKHHTEETKQKISKALTGKHHTDETRQKMSEAHRGEKNHNYGKHFSEETRQKLSESKQGEKNPNYGKHLSKETREKISESLQGENHPMYGKHFSKETCEKMSESHKEIHRNKLRDYDEERGQLLLFPKIYSTF